MENLKKVLSFVVELANVGDSVGRSKNWADLSNILDEVLALPSVDWSALVEEAKSPDMAALTSHINQKLDLVDDALEAKIETTVAALGGLGAVILVWAKKD